MKLNITFDSWEEFEQWRKSVGGITTCAPGRSMEVNWAECAETVPPEVTAYHEDLHRLAQEVAQNTQEADQDTQESAQKPQETDQKPQESAQEPVKIETVRKALADLNKKTGKNLAKELISEIGYSRLTDVPQERFPELMAKAEEVLNA